MTTLTGHEIDLTRCHFQRKCQDIMVYGTWHFGDHGAGPRPCLVLLPAYASSGHRPIPCVITVDEAYIWSKENVTREIVAEAVRLSVNYATLLRLNVADLGEPMRVAMLIHDHLGDLLSIPPLPQSERVSVADAIMVKEDGRITENEITDWQ